MLRDPKGGYGVGPRSGAVAVSELQNALHSQCYICDMQFNALHSVGYGGEAARDLAVLQLRKPATAAVRDAPVAEFAIRSQALIVRADSGPLGSRGTWNLACNVVEPKSDNI